MNRDGRAYALNTFLPVYFDLTPDGIVDRKPIDFVADFVLPRIDRNRILELGVGDQIWKRKLVERSTHVTTIEGSAESLDALKKTSGAITDWHGVVTLFEDFCPDEPYAAAWNNPRG